MKMKDFVKMCGKLVAIHSRGGERLYFFADNTMIPADLVNDDTSENVAKAMQGEEDE